MLIDGDNIETDNLKIQSANANDGTIIKSSIVENNNEYEEHFLPINTIDMIEMNKRALQLDEKKNELA